MPTLIGMPPNTERALRARKLVFQAMSGKKFENVAGVRGLVTLKEPVETDGGTSEPVEVLTHDLDTVIENLLTRHDTAHVSNHSWEHGDREHIGVWANRETSFPPATLRYLQNQDFTIIQAGTSYLKQNDYMRFPERADRTLAHIEAKR